MSVTNIYTSCTIQEFADWAVINPLLFNTLDPTPCGIEVTGPCEDFWEQYVMPDNSLSREVLALHIGIAEAKVRDYLGTFACPTWVVDEEHAIPTHYDRQRIAYPNVQAMVFKTDAQMVTRFGKRSTTLVDTPSLTYVDADGDGFNEVATLATTLPTGLTKAGAASSYKLFFTGEGGDEVFEVRPAKLDSYDSVTGSATWAIPSWLLVDPSIYLPRPFGSQSALNACDAGNYVADVEVRLVEGDTCLPQVEVLTKDASCQADCTLTATPACAVPVDLCAGTFKVRLQSVDATTGCVTTAPACLPSCDFPVAIRVSYEAGCSGIGSFDSCWLLREAVYKLAASSLPAVFCECSCLKPIVAKYQEETSLKVRNGNTWNFPSSARRLSPWGTTLGALEAFIAVDEYKQTMCA